MIQNWQFNQAHGLICFISDLHLFSDRCCVQEHTDVIRRSIERSDLCIWGGDLFDFRWSRLGCEERSVSEAIAWLDRWTQQFPQKQFLYLDGNHDAHLPFRLDLKTWSQGVSTFNCGYNSVRIGDTVFTHGDVIEGRGSLQAFRDYRASWENKPVASRFASRAYDVAIAVRAHQVAALTAHRKRSTCLRLLRWLHRQDSESVTGVRRFVFGHTHRRLLDYEVGGVRFYNGGAAIRHVPFSPILIDYQDAIDELH